MAAQTNPANDLRFLQGGEEMGERIRQFDWSGTPLGDFAYWPEVLRHTVRLMLNNPFGMYIAWGKEYIQFYNDGYRPILGQNKHPHALGKSSSETFSEIWHIIGKMFDEVMQGSAVRRPDFLLPLNRNGYLEDCYFDFSYSPIPLEDGTTGGVLVTVVETTEKIKALEALKQSESKFRQMANGLPLVIWTAAATGLLTFISNQWEDFYGNPIDESLGTGWLSYVHPNDVDYAVDGWKKSIATGTVYEIEFRVLHKSGSYHWVLVRALPIKNDDGKIVSWYGSNTDIQDKKINEDLAKESEARFKTMAEASDILISVADIEFKTTFFNKAWEVLTGRMVADLLNHGWVDLIHPEDKENFLNTYLKAFEKKQSFIAQFRVLGNTGEYRWLLSKIPARFNPNGSHAGYISSSIDITESKQIEGALIESEQNIRNIILQAPVAMCILREADFTVEIANLKMFEIWDKPGYEVLNKPIFEVLPEAKGQGLEALLENVYKSGEKLEMNEMPIFLPRNGKIEKVYINFVCQALRKNDGSINGILGVAIDVSAQVIARRKIEEIVGERTKELAAANKDLQKSNAELAQFAYIASHDLQEPLRKISTFSQMLERSLGDAINENGKQYLVKINNASTRMNKLIRDVLSYSELVKETEEFAAVNLNEVLENIKSDYDLLIEEKHATFIVAELPVVQAIPLQMLQLFGNLVGNSLKFSRKEIPPVITIHAQVVQGDEVKDMVPDENKQYYHITFSDNGIGFKAEHSDQIFNIFQRLHRKNEYEGTGIGLAMCKKIIINHRGSMNAYGSSEEGAVFNIILPVQQ